MSLSSEEQGAALGAFARALRRETNVLGRRPEIAWQQLANRLQWEEEPVASLVEAELDVRNAAGAEPWLWLRTLVGEAALRQVLEAHSRANGCAFSPDGALLVSLGDGTVRLWDARSGAPGPTLEGHIGGTNACAFSPDGARLASAGPWGALFLWDPRTGEHVATLAGHGVRDGRVVVGAGIDDVKAVAFSPDGAVLASAGADGTLRLWDGRTGEARALLAAHKGGVNGCAFSPDGALVASTGYDGAARIWDSARGKKLRTVRRRWWKPLKGHRGRVRGCAFSPDGSLLAIATYEEIDLTSTLLLVDARTAALRQVLEDVTDGVFAFSPDGDRIAAAGDGGIVRIRHARTGEAGPRLEGHARTVTGCAFSPDGALLASAGSDGTLRVWNAGTSDSAALAVGHTREVRGYAFSPDGTLVVSASDDGTLRLWDADSGAELGVLEGHAGWVFACAFSPDGALLASASGDSTLRLWDPRTGEPRDVLEGHTGPIYGCAFSPDGRFLASASFGALCLWDLSTRSRRLLTGHPSSVTGCAFSPDGALLASTSGRTLRLWNVRTGTPGRVFVVRTHWTNACAYSPDGVLIASASAASETLRLWHARTGDAGPLLEGHIGGVWGCAFSPDGALLASAGVDQTLRLWHMREATAGPVLELPAEPLCVAFAPDRPRLACGDAAGRVHRVELGGIEYGPLVVTALDSSSGPELRCPACSAVHPVDASWSGRVIPCLACGRELRVNPFSVGGET